MDDHVDVTKRVVDRPGVREVGDNRVEAVPLRLLAKPVRITPAEDDVDTILLGESRDQIAGVTVGPVDENLG
jgi:hypothetical protein